MPATFWLFDSETRFGREAGTFVLKCEVPKFRLYMGSYTVAAWLSERRGNTYFEVVRRICPFEVSMRTFAREEYDWAPDLSTYKKTAPGLPVQFIMRMMMEFLQPSPRPELAGIDT